MSHFEVAVTMALTFDIVSRILVSGAYIYPISFEVGISNLLCGCILGWRSDASRFGVTLTLISDLVSRIIMSGQYPLPVVTKATEE